MDEVEVVQVVQRQLQQVEASPDGAAHGEVDGLLGGVSCPRQGVDAEGVAKMNAMDIPYVVGRWFPDVAPERLAVRRGQFHLVVVGPDRVVCLPRTPAAAARLPRRADVLRLLAGLGGLGVPVPRPLESGGEEYLVLSRVPGEPLETLADARAADALAGLLAALARAGADEGVRAALPVTPQDRWRRFSADVRAELFLLMSGDGRLRAERELAAAVALPHVTTAVVHGDLGPENILWEVVDGRPRLSGVIDWDEAALGDPAEDLAALAAGFGDDVLGRVLAHADDMEGRVAAIRGTFALQQALSGVRDGDEEELADGLAAYGYRR
ncbi:aminoglycoside phosphotransferase family protein [Nonomuraea sp. NPDC046802]|uniref:aminoglycoside phosphotransferase family protein n=1 Tax=Nonomuraea sp. NPDC046802 TaxID=3154919 RepID=UPI0033C58E23